MTYLRPAFFIVALAMLSPSVHAAQTTIAPSKDNTIFQNAVNNSAGGGPGIFVGTTATTSPHRGLLAFDIAANVPAGVTITGAQLTMYLGSAPNSNPQTVGLHRLGVNWGEGTAGSSNPNIGGGGTGAAAGAGDATWTTPTFGSGTWTNPGGTGDFNAAASAAAVVTGPAETAFNWLSTPTLVSDLQGWLDNPATNFGWALVNGNESSSATVKVFYSRSATLNSLGGSLNPAFRPALTVIYTPEPSTAFLLLLALPLAILRRRR